MRLPILLTCLLLLSACSQTESNAARVFESAFAMEAPPGDVVVMNGYRLERRKWFETKEMWRLHLAGPGAKRFAEKRWPDLQPGVRRVFVQGSQTPWFAPGKELKYITYRSPTDPAVTLMQPEGSQEVFIAYDNM
jgi:hypothetical protein